MAWIRRYEQKKVISKILFDSNFTFVMHDYVHWHSSIDYCLLSRWQDFKQKWLSFLKEMISAAEFPAEFLLGKCASWRRATYRHTQFKFWIVWEHPLYEIWGYAFNLMWYKFILTWRNDSTWPKPQTHLVEGTEGIVQKICSPVVLLVGW